MQIKHAALCFALAFAPACHKADPAEKSVQLMEDLGDAADSANGDCKKLAESMKTIAAKYQGDVAAMKAESEKMKNDKEAEKALEEKYAGRIEKAMPKVMKLLKCADDEGFKAAGKPLEGLY
jgi:hypothetical protein